MPHKRNPVLTENLTGLARMVRSFAMPAMENVALWHERDISHSSVERMIGPDATVTLDFALARLTGVIDKLLVYPDNMLKNLNRFRGLVHSQRVLLALTQAGVSREDAYRLVQRNAMKVWEKGADFLEELLADKEVRAALSGRRDPREFRPRLSHQARRHDFQAGVWEGLKRQAWTAPPSVLPDISPARGEIGSLSDGRLQLRDWRKHAAAISPPVGGDVRQDRGRARRNSGLASDLIAA